MSRSLCSKPLRWLAGHGDRCETCGLVVMCRFRLAGHLRPPRRSAVSFLRESQAPTREAHCSSPI